MPLLTSSIPYPSITCITFFTKEHTYRLQLRLPLPQGHRFLDALLARLGPTQVELICQFVALHSVVSALYPSIAFFGAMSEVVRPQVVLTGERPPTKVAKPLLFVRPVGITMATEMLGPLEDLHTVPTTVWMLGICNPFPTGIVFRGLSYCERDRIAGPWLVVTRLDCC